MPAGKLGSNGGSAASAAVVASSISRTDIMGISSITLAGSLPTVDDVSTVARRELGRLLQLLLLVLLALLRLPVDLNTLDVVCGCGCTAGGTLLLVTVVDVVARAGRTATDATARTGRIDAGRLRVDGGVDCSRLPPAAALAAAAAAVTGGDVRRSMVATVSMVQLRRCALGRLSADG